MTDLSSPTLLDTQLALIHQRWPQATIAPVGDGSHVVTVPGYHLIDGWNREYVTIRFHVPVGFPCARPQHFWLDEDLLLADGRRPRWAITYKRDYWTAPLQGDRPYLLFLYRPMAWSPNGDTLLTYLHVIRQRLAMLE